MNNPFPFLDLVFPDQPTAVEIPKPETTERQKCILHRYRRMKSKPGQILFRCAAPHCMSAPIAKARLDGKEVLCYYCHQPMFMTNSKMRNSYPQCGCQNKVRTKICARFLDDEYHENEMTRDKP